jgi:hypothetical protein
LLDNYGEVRVRAAYTTAATSFGWIPTSDRPDVPRRAATNPTSESGHLAVPAVSGGVHRRDVTVGTCSGMNVVPM